MLAVSVTFFVLLCLVTVTFAQLSDDPGALLNWCLDSKHHKKNPGPEDNLHNQCTPWKNRSCCTANTTWNLHYSSLYRFNYNHCSHKKNISEACYRHFVQDNCFYECSPNIGPWVVKVNMKIRKERFFRVPLCASDCNAWFEACKDDFTCSDNWIKNEIKNGTLNPCVSGKQCDTFSSIFKTPGNFCEKVWDHSWAYTQDSEPCMRIWFDGENPNDNVAKFYSQMLTRSNSASYILINTSYIILIALSILYIRDSII